MALTDADIAAMMQQSEGNIPNITVVGSGNELTDEDIATMMAEQQPQKVEMSAGEYLTNQAKLGSMDMFSLARAAAQDIIIDPLRVLGIVGGETKGFGEHLREGQEAGARITGAETRAVAPSKLVEVVGGGVRALSDPLGYIGAPVKAATTAGRAIAGGSPAVGAIAGALPSAATRAGGLGISGMGAEFGGQMGGEFEEAITGQNTGIGRMVGSLFGGVAGVPGASLTAGAVKTAGSAAKQTIDKWRMVRNDPDAVIESYAQGATKRLFEQAQKANPDLKQALDDYNAVSNQLTGQNLPIFAAAADNPTIRAETIRLAKSNPEYKAAFEAELQTIATKLGERADKVFGERYAQLPEGVSTVSLKNVQKRIESIDDQLGELSTKYSYATTENARENIGRIADKLIETKKADVRAQMAPLYDNVMERAKKSGAVLPEQDVANIYNFVVGNNIRDIFGKTSALDKQIMKYLSPTEIGFAPLSFSNVDSLKRAINTLQRSKLTDDEARKLLQLEDVINQGRKNIKGNFSDELAAIDRQYYERLGVPFGANGIKDIESTKYATNVAPILTRSSQQTREFLNAVGEEGIPVVRNAIIMDAYKKGFNADTGAFNRKAFVTYLNDKKDVISQVPGLREELSQTIADESVLRLAKNRIDLAYKKAEAQVADNFITKSDFAPDYKSLVSSIVTNNTQRQKVLNDIKQLDPASSKAVKNAIRREFVETAANSTQGMYKYINDPAHQKFISEVFGSTYVGEVNKFAKLIDKLKSSDLEKTSSIVSQKDLDAAGAALARYGFPGLDMPYVSSQLRDRIASWPQKLVRLASRVQVEATKQKTQQEFFEFLSDPNGIQKLNKVSKEFDFNIKNPVAYKKIMETFFELMPQYFYAGSKIGANPAEQADEEATFIGE